MYKSILVPLDGSEVAASVLPYVADLAKRLGAAVTLLTVMAPARPAPAGDRPRPPGYRPTKQEGDPGKPAGQCRSQDP